MTQPFVFPQNERDWCRLLGRTIPDLQKTALELEREWDIMVEIHKRGNWGKCLRCHGTVLDCLGNNTCKRASHSLRGRAFISTPSKQWTLLTNSA